MDEPSLDDESSLPAWTAFGDLMTVLLGAFMLLLVGVLASQLELSDQLQTERAQREAETAERESLAQVLAIPLAAGRVTLRDGRIGISGRLLFDLNSDRLQPAGRELLRSLVPPLREHLNTRDQMLMVSGFTDDRLIHQGNRRFDDNWELSAQRALTVTRFMIDAGMPPDRVFAAAFGAEQPQQPNRHEKSRAQNRRVEHSPVPRLTRTTTPRP